MLTQKSMQKFAELLRVGLEEQGHDVRLVRPAPIFGRLAPERSFIRKWAGYIDQLILFPFKLLRASKWADVTHVCDHSNAMFLPYIAGPKLITCHDVLGIRSAMGGVDENKVGLTGRVLQRWIRSNLERAPVVVCVSAATATDLVEVTTVRSSRVSVIENALNYPFQRQRELTARSWLTRLGVPLDQPFFMHVGSNVWYKNRAGALRIFAALRVRPEFQQHVFFFAGQPLTEELQALIEDLGLTNSVRVLCDVSDQELEALYSTASALIFPSLTEGFGWPVIEAQACGCLVITSNRAPMRDVAGGAAILIEPTSPEDAAVQISRAWGLREQYIEKGLRNVARYSRQAMSDSYFVAYEKAFAED